MPVPLLDLKREYQIYREDLEAAALRVLRSTRYVLGEEVESLEHELAEYVGSSEVVGMSSGTDALLAALMALGIGPGCAVALPVYSFFATAGVVARVGARPVFVDVEPVWCNLDATALEAILDEQRVDAVIFTHLYGSGEGARVVADLCKARHVPLIEDAAQAIGTRTGGTAAGTLGAVGCFSTFPSKNLGGVGDGGFATTNDPDLAVRLRQLRNHGQSAAYEHALIGGNFRLDALQAACLRVKLRHLEDLIGLRRANAGRYRELAATWLPPERVRLPADIEDRHSYHQFVVHLEREPRDAVRRRLTERGIGNAVYYPIPFHLQPCFRDLGWLAGDFPVAERAARTNLALPIFPMLLPDEQDTVMRELAAALRSA